MLCRTTFSSNIYTYTSVLYPHRPTCMHELRNKNLIKIQIYFSSIRKCLSVTLPVFFSIIVPKKFSLDFEVFLPHSPKLSLMNSYSAQPEWRQVRRLGISLYYIDLARMQIFTNWSLFLEILHMHISSVLLKSNAFVFCKEYQSFHVEFKFFLILS